MVVDAVAGRRRRERVGSAPIYEFFGMRVQSDIALPLAEAPVIEREVVIRRMPEDLARPTMTGVPAAVMRCEHGTIQCVRYVRSDGAWIDKGNVLFHIYPGGERVDVYANGNVESLELPLLLLGQVAVLLLRTRHKLVLHSSAVATPDGSVAFLAPKGGGKSSLAAGFLYEGDSLLTDDVLVVNLREQGAQVIPGPAIMKLWQQTLDELEPEHAALPPLLQGIDKKLLRIDGQLRLAHEPRRLQALYLLDRYEPTDASDVQITLAPVSGTNALATLISQTSWSELLAPSELAGLLPEYSRLLQQVPLRQLRYPSGFRYQAAVRAAIREDLRRV